MAGFCKYKLLEAAYNFADAGISALPAFLVLLDQNSATSLANEEFVCISFVGSSYSSSLPARKLHPQLLIYLKKIFI